MLASITVEVMRLLKLKKLSLFQILKIRWDYSCFGGFPCGTVAKNLSANAGDAGSVPESGRSPEREMATHSSILAWEIPWTEEPGGP